MSMCPLMRPQISLDVHRCPQTPPDTQAKKTPAVARFSGLSRPLSDRHLVEAAGIEPASESPLPSDLHA